MEITEKNSIAPKQSSPLFVWGMPLLQREGEREKKLRSETSFPAPAKEKKEESKASRSPIREQGKDSSGKRKANAADEEKKMGRRVVQRKSAKFLGGKISKKKKKPKRHARRASLLQEKKKAPLLEKKKSTLKGTRRLGRGCRMESKRRPKRWPGLARGGIALKTAPTKGKNLPLGGEGSNWLNGGQRDRGQRPPPLAKSARR